MGVCIALLGPVSNETIILFVVILAVLIILRIKGQKVDFVLNGKRKWPTYIILGLAVLCSLPAAFFGALLGYVGFSSHVESEHIYGYIIIGTSLLHVLIPTGGLFLTFRMDKKWLYNLFIALGILSILLSILACLILPGGISAACM